MFASDVTLSFFFRATRKRYLIGDEDSKQPTRPVNRSKHIQEQTPVLVCSCLVIAPSPPEAKKKKLERGLKTVGQRQLPPPVKAPTMSRHPTPCDCVRTIATHKPRARATASPTKETTSIGAPQRRNRGVPRRNHVTSKLPNQVTMSRRRKRCCLMMVVITDAHHHGQQMDTCPLVVPPRGLESRTSVLYSK